MGVARRCAAEAAARHLPVNGRRRFSGTGGSRGYSRTLTRAIGLVALLCAAPPASLCVPCAGVDAAPFAHFAGPDAAPCQSSPHLGAASSLGVC